MVAHFLNHSNEHEDHVRYNPQEIYELKATLSKISNLPSRSHQEDNNKLITHLYMLSTLFFYMLLVLLKP